LPDRNLVILRKIAFALTDQRSKREIVCSRHLMVRERIVNSMLPNAGAQVAPLGVSHDSAGAWSVSAGSTLGNARVIPDGPRVTPAGGRFNRELQRLTAGSA